MTEKVSPRLDLGRLPIPGKVFVGRQKELQRLDDAWADDSTHVVTLVAFGGVGKSALVARWLGQMAADGWRGAARVLDWSFYSQGSEERVASADGFIDHALRFFGDEDPTKGSPHDRGRRLAELVRKEKTLLVLDGVEPLQYPPGRPEVAGRFKDPGLAALLKGLAAGNPGLCVVTTREHVADLAGWQQTAPQVDLEKLEPEAAVELLKALGVDGAEKELGKAVEEFQRHALTLTLLGNYLRRAHNGDIRKRKEIDLTKVDEEAGGPAARVIVAYCHWLGDGPEVAILQLLGFFDRPADRASLKVLRARPAIPGLTGKLVGLAEDDWRIAVSTLREHGLIAEAASGEPDTLDAHPLVRAYFAGEATRKKKSWVEGNRRLYQHLCKAAPEFPETLEELQPLYNAMLHGCRAGRQQEVMDDVYWRRILQGSEFFSLNKLGAFGSELTALAGFFDNNWSQTSTHLTSEAQAFLSNQVGVCLRALGRLVDAVEPMEVSLRACLGLEHFEDWTEASIRANNLSELTLRLGDVRRAVAFGEQCVELADRSGDVFKRLSDRTTWADAQHQAGRRQESAAAFREAEALLAGEQPEYPRLSSLGGFRYCELLLSEAEPEGGASLDGLAALASRPEEAERVRTSSREVQDRSRYALRIATATRRLLDIALSHLTLGHSSLYPALLAFTDDRAAGLALAGDQLNQAVEGLRRAAQEDHLPRGLLARAALRRFLPDHPGAEADLAEALEIAERGGMRLFECDAHLELARLRRDQGLIGEARRHWARARELVTATGYGRREREVVWLAGALEKAERELAASRNKIKATPFDKEAEAGVAELRFRVALSFPGEAREEIEAVAKGLAGVVGRERVLYDQFHRGEFAKPDLDVSLPRLYREQSELIVLFLSPDYAKKRWCRLEWRHIRQLLATVESDRIMLLRFGDPGDLSELGILPGDGYVDVEGWPAQAITDLILERLEGRPGSGVPVPAAPSGGAATASSNPKALALWREKLAFLEEQEALAVDGGQKFALLKQIEEARRKVREYGG